MGVGLPQHGQQAFGGRDRALEVAAAAYLKALQDDLSAVQLFTKSLELLQRTAGPQNKDGMRVCYIQKGLPYSTRRRVSVTAVRLEIENT